MSFYDFRDFGFLQIKSRFRAILGIMSRRRGILVCECGRRDLRAGVGQSRARRFIRYGRHMGRFEIPFAMAMRLSLAGLGYLSMGFTPSRMQVRTRVAGDTIVRVSGGQQWALFCFRVLHITRMVVCAYMESINPLKQSITQPINPGMQIW